MAHRPDPFTGGDPNVVKKLGRGGLTIDAVLDLHGHSQTTGHRAFVQFVHRAATMRMRYLLVITGKGVKVEDAGIARRGVLRQRFSEWVREPDMAHLIARVAQAHPRHGGSGAHYIILRSKTGLSR